MKDLAMTESTNMKSLIAALDLVNPCWELAKEKIELAPRLQTLSGKRAGFLDNRKDTADIILKRIGSRLESDCGAVQSTYHTKAVYSRRAEVSILDELARTCDFVITATGA